MSMMRCDKHGSWDSDLVEECELCLQNKQEASFLRLQADKFDPPFIDGEQCTYCKLWYLKPVSYHHTEVECGLNMADSVAANGMEKK